MCVRAGRVRALAAPAPGALTGVGVQVLLLVVLALLHLLEGQEVGLDGDAEVADTLEDLQGARLLDAVLKALAVDLEDLVASLKANVISL